MRFKFQILFVLCTSIISSVVFAQGDYLKKGVSGVEAIGSYINDDISSGYGIQIGISLNGVVDVGFAATAFNIDSEYDFINVKAKSYVTFVMFHFVKQNKYKIPLTSSLIVGYSNTNITEDRDFEYGDISYKEGRFAIGLGLIRNEKISQEILLQPRCEVLIYPHIESYDVVTYDGRTDYSKIVLNPEFNLGLSLIIGTDQNRNPILRIGPALQFSKGTTTYSINAGVIVPFGGSHSSNDTDDDW